MPNLSLMWRKNKPDLVAIFRNGFPSFIWQANPRELTVDDGVPVFCYHRADPDVVDRDFAFLEQNGYRTASIDEYLTGSSQDSPKQVLLTVDDGASDLYTVFYPALKKHGLKAVAFVAPAFHQDDYDLPDGARPCTWAELKEMEDSGCVDVQAHTWSHRYIPNWPEPIDLVGIDTDFSRSVQQREELTLAEDLRRAKSVLEERLEKEVRHMAFPMYQGTPTAIDRARQCGYASCWWGTLPRQPLNPPGHSPYHMARLDAQFIRRLPGEGRRSLYSLLRLRCKRSAE